MPGKVVNPGVGLGAFRALKETSYRVDRLGRDIFGGRHGERPRRGGYFAGQVRCASKESNELRNSGGGRRGLEWSVVTGHTIFACPDHSPLVPNRPNSKAVERGSLKTRLHMFRTSQTLGLQGAQVK